jgi:hypothetical protein
MTPAIEGAGGGECRLDRGWLTGPVAQMTLEEEEVRRGHIALCCCMLIVSIAY